MKNILVALDFKGNNQALVDQSIVLAEKFGSKIWLIHIAAPDPDFVSYEMGPQYIRDFQDDELKEQHQILIQFAEKLKEKGFESEGILIEGPTVKTLLKEAEKVESDLIIIGNHEHSVWYKAFFGSTSERVIAKSKIPVLVVHI